MESTSDDYSILKPSLLVGDSGPYGVLKMINSGTQEIRDLLIAECEIIYECKVCKNLFRSLANFTSHKRFYCKCRYFESKSLQEDKELTIKYINDYTEQCDNIPETKRKIDFVLKKLTEKTISNASENSDETAKSDVDMYLENISQNKNAMYQTFNSLSDTDKTNLMSSRLSEIRRSKTSKESVELGSDGKIKGSSNSQTTVDPKQSSIHSETSRKKEVEDIYSNRCKFCNTYYSSAKALRYHMRTHQSLSVYRCPVCNGAFTNMGILLKHFGTVHNKSESEIKKLKIDIMSQSNNGSTKLTNINSTALRCNSCSKRFTSKDNLMKHSKKCVMKSKICNKSTQIIKSGRNSTKNPCFTGPKLFSKECQLPPKSEQTSKKPIRIEIREDYGKDLTSKDNCAFKLPKPKCSRKSFNPRKRNLIADSEDSLISCSKITKPNPVTKSSNYDSRTCRKCQKRCKSFSLLKSHYKTHFQVDGLFKCSFCGFVSTQYLCTQHVFKIHYGSEERSFADAEEKVFQVEKEESQTLSEEFSDQVSNSDKDDSRDQLIISKCEEPSSPITPPPKESSSEFELKSESESSIVIQKFHHSLPLQEPLSDGSSSHDESDQSEQMKIENCASTILSNHASIIPLDDDDDDDEEEDEDDLESPTTNTDKSDICDVPFSPESNGMGLSNKYRSLDSNVYFTQNHSKYVGENKNISTTELSPDNAERNSSKLVHNSPPVRLGDSTNLSNDTTNLASPGYLSCHTKVNSPSYVNANDTKHMNKQDITQFNHESTSITNSCPR